MRSVLLLSLLLVVLASGRTWDRLDQYTFESYLAEFGKEYAANEIEFRRSLFNSRLNDARLHNADAGKSWKMGVNHFTDMTEAEIKAFRGFNKALSSKTKRETLVTATEFKADISALPTSVDWRTKGVVSRTKNQGGCGSCWAFGSAETLESHLAIQTGKLLVLSEQNLVACAPNPDHCGGNGGCQGSIPELAFKYVKENGLALEKDYPYVGIDSKCNASVPKAIKITGYTKLKENDYNSVMTAVATVGPLAVNVAAMSWSFYEGGIYDGCNMTHSSSTDIDHVVQLVGYGTERGIDYWWVRNSWGQLWGEGGYIRLRRRDPSTYGQQCGIDKTPSDGTACMPFPDSVQVCGECGILYDASYPTGVTLA